MSKIEPSGYGELVKALKERIRSPFPKNQHQKTDRLENDRIIAIDAKWDERIFYPALIPKENAHFTPTRGNARSAFL